MRMRSLLRPSPETWITQNSSCWKSLPSEIWLLILENLSPIDAYNILFVNHFFRELTRNEPKIWTGQHKDPSSSGSSSQPLYQAWLSKFRLLKPRHKDIIVEINSKLDIFSDEDLSIISSVEKILHRVTTASWVSVEVGASALGSTAPTSAYILIEKSCVERALSLVQNGQLSWGKGGMVIAGEVAKMHGSSLPTSHYFSFEKTCAEQGSQGQTCMVIAAEVERPARPAAMDSFVGINGAGKRRPRRW